MSEEKSDKIEPGDTKKQKTVTVLTWCILLLLLGKLMSQNVGLETVHGLGAVWSGPIDDNPSG